MSLGGLGLLSPDGSPAYYSDPDDGRWAVHVGPIPDDRFRRTVIEFVEKNVLGADPASLDAQLKHRRVRLVGELSKATAEVIVKDLGGNKVAGSVETGPPPRAGIEGAFKYGTPLLALIGGGLVGIIWTPIGWAVGAAAAIGLGVLNARQVMPVIGSLPPEPALPEPVKDARGRLQAVGDRLDEESRAQVRVAAGTGFAILSRLMRAGSPVALDSGSQQGGMANAAMGLINETVRIAESIARDGAGSAEHQQRLDKLAKLSETGGQFERELERLERSLGDGSADAEAQLQQEIAHVQQTLDALKT